MEIKSLEFVTDDVKLLDLSRLSVPDFFTMTSQLRTLTNLLYLTLSRCDVTQVTVAVMGGTSSVSMGYYGQSM